MPAVTAEKLRAITSTQAAKDKAINKYVAELHVKVVDAAASGATSYSEPVTTFPWHDWNEWADQPAPLGEVTTFPWVEPEVQNAIKEAFPGSKVTYDDAANTLWIDWTNLQLY